MIRAKQLGTLSQSARSFILSGTRSSAADGSCSCSEDESCNSRRPQTKNTVRHLEISSASVSKDGVKAVNFQKNEKPNYSVSEPQVIPYTNSSKRADCVSYGSLEASDIMHSSPPISDQFVRAGIAAVNFLSDLVHYKIPMSDGNEVLKSSPNCVVERTKPISTVKPSTVKSFRKDQVYGKAPAITPAASSSVNNPSDTGGRVEKYGSAKGTSSISNNSMGNFVEDRHAFASDSHDRKRTVPPKSRPYSARFKTYAQASHGEHINERPECLSRPIRETKVNTEVATRARQFSSSASLVDRVSHTFYNI
nr:pentatricopeptide repeat-containing protein At1g74750-like [Ipomoea batatas]